MLAAVHFQNFKALRSAALRLEPCNIVLGPNGSGKTSLIQALLRLRSLSALPATHAHELKGRRPGGPQIEFHFQPPFQNVRVTLGCNSDELVCNALIVDHPPGLPGAAQWAELRTRLQTIRAFLLDHYAMTVPAKREEADELSSNGGNIAAVLARWQTAHPKVFATLEAEFCRLLPEFGGLRLREAGSGRVELTALLRENGHEAVSADNLSQGTLYLLALLVLAYAPQPPAVVCLEEPDRGIHPRALREVRDQLYRLCYPQDFGMERVPVQVIATSHSPYFLDQFREHPEEVVLASKRGKEASFERLSERTDLLELMKEAHLGDLWYSGVLGGVPEM
jgi:predicted ATPase